METQIKSCWKELIGRKDEFLGIVRLLVEFDERTGRFRRYGTQETHYLRKAMSVSKGSSCRIFLLNRGSFSFSIVVSMETAGGVAVTSWIHEDGIRAERETCEDQGHPVWSILCMSDLYDKDTMELDLDSELEPAALRMIVDAAGL